jgi:Domain of unknown function (DUF1707)
MSLDLTLRIGDADRDRVVAVLGQHLGLGHLTMQELENRLDTAYAARNRGELDAVLAGLPAIGPPRPLPSPPRSGPSAGPPWTTWAPWAPWVPWVLTGAICLLIWVTTSVAHGHPLYFWPLWVIGPWGAVLLAHTAVAPPGGQSGRPISRAAPVARR